MTKVPDDVIVKTSWYVVQLFDFQLINQVDEICSPDSDHIK
jgi:hypothetical protein